MHLDVAQVFVRTHGERGSRESKRCRPLGALRCVKDRVGRECVYSLPGHRSYSLALSRLRAAVSMLRREAREWTAAYQGTLDSLVHSLYISGDPFPRALSASLLLTNATISHLSAAIHTGRAILTNSELHTMLLQRKDQTKQFHLPQVYITTEESKANVALWKGANTLADVVPHITKVSTLRTSRPYRVCWDPSVLDGVWTEVPLEHREDEVSAKIEMRG